MSGSYYMVVRCVPDAIADEFVNVGVIAWEADRSRFLCRFTDDLSRAHAIGLEGDGTFLRDFFDRMREDIAAANEASDGAVRYRLEKDLSRMQGWGGSIQCFGWCGAILPAEETLESAVKAFMKSAVS